MAKNLLQQFNQVTVIVGVYIDDKKLVIIKEPKTIHFDPKACWKHEIDFIKKQWILTEHAVKKKIRQLSKYKHGSRYSNNEPDKFVLNFPQGLDLKSLNKTCCPSKLVYLLHMEKYKATAQEQQIQNNSSKMEWWILIGWWFLFRVRYLWLYRVYH